MPDAYLVAADIDAATDAVAVAVIGAVRKSAQLGLARVRVNASGRPGPRRVTGDYLRSMAVEYDGPTKVIIGTNAPQGRRLEYGFYNMTDRLGRTFQQPAYPHWRPMADWLTDTAAEMIAAAFRGLTG